jgi:4'-phosphopantetheinyl transferase
MSNQWSFTPFPPPLESGEVQLWRVDLADIGDRTSVYSSSLSAEEQVIANRRRAGRTRDHFTIGRACLRSLLGNALNVDPTQIAVTEGPHGKPEISGSTLHFNVAHSKDTILIALSRHNPVGVDVEYMDRPTDLMDVAQANFTEDETASLLAITGPTARRKLFYTYWTRKEAVVKADGRGLLLPLTSFDVSGGSMEHHPVLVREASEERSTVYFLSDLDLGDHAVGALALQSSECAVRRLIFPLGSIGALGLQ